VLRCIHLLTLITRIEAYPDLEQKDADTFEAAVDQMTPYDVSAILNRPQHLICGDDIEGISSFGIQAS
jgi:hypothetical protein